MPQQTADLVELVVTVDAPAELFLLDAAPDLIHGLGAELTTWKASSTCTASDNESRSALA